jgi:hypothetical protein
VLLKIHNVILTLTLLLNNLSFHFNQFQVLFLCLSFLTIQLYRFVIKSQGCLVSSEGLKGRWLGFDSQQGEDFSLLHSVQSSSGSHSALYSLVLGALPQAVK